MPPSFGSCSPAGASPAGSSTTDAPPSPMWDGAIASVARGSGCASPKSGSGSPVIALAMSIAAARAAACSSDSSRDSWTSTKSGSP